MSNPPDWAETWLDTNCAGCGEEYYWEDGAIRCSCSVIRMGVV